MRTSAMAAVGFAAVLAGTAVTTTTHASAGLLGGLGLGSRANHSSLLGGVLPLQLGSITSCLNILHAGGVNLIGSGKQLGAGCTDTKYGPGYGTNLLTLPALPASPFIGSCQTLLRNIGTQLPLIGFQWSTGAGLRTSCGTDTSPLDPLTQLLGLG